MPRLKRGRPAWPPDPCASCAAVTALLDTRQIGVVHLDRRGRILAANDRARHLLRQGDGVADRAGKLRARGPEDQPRLDRLVAAALPGSGSVAVSGSMPLHRSSVLLPLVVHVKPVRGPQPGPRRAGRGRAGPGGRAGVPAADRSRRDRRDAGPDAGRKSGGGVVGGRPDCGRHGSGHRSHQRRHLLAPEADLPETSHLPAGGPGPARAVDR